MILIGSRALALRAPALLNRKPIDFDFVATRDEAIGWLDYPYYEKDGKIISEETEVPCEFDVSSPSNELLNDLVGTDLVAGRFGRVPSLDILFTIKSSHKYKKNSPHFWKTAQDFHRMRNAGAQIIPELHKLREAESYAAQSHPVLMQGKKDFFKDDGIQYKYDHDSIHRSVSLQERPAYTYFTREGEEVFSSKSKFYDQTLQIQLHSVVEESAVLACERSLVPFPGALTPKQAWHYALSKVCSSIASGWWREFAYLNIPAILKLYPENYFEMFKAGLSNGVVKECT